MGLVTCAGIGVEPLWESVFQDRSLIHEGFGRVDENTLLALGRDGDALPFAKEREQVASDLPRSKFALFALHAIAQAMRSAGWESLGEQDGVILGTTTGGILYWEPEIIRLGRGEVHAEALLQSLRREPLGLSLNEVTRLAGLRGPSCLLTSACTSSSQAIGLGALWLKSGKVKRCLVGGAEVLCRLTTDGFRSLQLLSESPATPFDENRAGINLSEGAAFLCLETGNLPRALAQVRGYGFRSDAYHMTAPHPEGRGSFEAMRAALEMGGVSPGEIDWVHAHGTGSAANDLAEGMAIAQLFGQGGNPIPWTSSTKGVHGHALAASGAIETAFCIKAIHEGLIPRTNGLKAPDPKIRLRHPMKHENATLRYVLKNSLGFGGANAAILLSRVFGGGGDA